MKNTKIICTIGPASIKREVINELFNAGMNVARINLSHGDFKQYEVIINNVRSVGDIPIIIDTQGPEIRTINDFIEFSRGDVIKLGLSVNVFSDLSVGVKVLLNDGVDKGVITCVGDDFILVKMLTDGSIKPNRSIIFRGVNFNLPSLTKKDLLGVKFALKNNIEFIALSFTRSKSDVIALKKLLGDSGIMVIAKIENHEGVRNIDEIIDVADAIMVARGDLGVEVPSERVPIIQKRIISKCNKAGKPVIVATQMMESMIHHKSPTRAETSDVANAIIDGVDAVMLSGETSIGDYPVLVVKKVSSICRSVERFVKSRVKEVGNSIPNNVACNAFQLSKKLGARIICLTHSGFTARLLSRFKPSNLIAVTPNKLTYLQLMISYGVKPIFYPSMREYNNGEVDDITSIVFKDGLISADDLIVFVAGLFVKCTTNTIIVFNARNLLSHSKAGKKIGF